MSDSEDDMPLAGRAAAAPKAEEKADQPKPAQPAAAPSQASKPAAKPKSRTILDSDDSDDDKPLAFSRKQPAGQSAQKKPAAAAKPAPRPAPKADKPKGDRPAKTPQSAAEQQMKQREAAVKRQVEEEQAVGERKAEKQAVKHKQVTPKGAKAAKADGKGSAKGGKENQEEKKRAPKKEYDMPGQKKDTPLETDALRRFYTSLREQRPDSEMAEKWLLEHGLLEREEAEELVSKLTAGKKQPARSPARPRAKPPNSDGKAAAARKNGAAAGSRKRKASDDPHRKPIAKRAPKGTGRKDSAFRDGGLDATDSDDDLPLGARAKIAAK